MGSQTSNWDNIYQEHRPSEEQLHRLTGCLNNCSFWSPKNLDYSYLPTGKFKCYCVGALFGCSEALGAKAE